MTVRQLMSEGVVTIKDTATCHDAVERMMRHRVRHLPVIDGSGRLCGVVTDRDLRHHLFEPKTFTRIGAVRVEKLLKDTPVSQVMSTPVITVGADEPLETAARLMLQDKVGSVPVVDDGRLVGIITETDLLKRIVGEDACCGDVETIVVSYP
jgi:acetoin utilization protein AcuB